MERQLAVCFSVLLVWFEHWLYVRQGSCCNLRIAHTVNTKLGKCAESNTTKEERKEKRYDTDKKYILNQAYQV